jgi:hypothetical protein
MFGIFALLLHKWHGNCQRRDAIYLDSTTAMPASTPPETAKGSRSNNCVTCLDLKGRRLVGATLVVALLQCRFPQRVEKKGDHKGGAYMSRQAIHLMLRLS